MANKFLKLPNGKLLKLGGSTGETWVINSTPDVTEDVYSNINFKSNNLNFSEFRVSAGDIYYNYSQVYIGDLESWRQGQAYRTVTFETAPTGELLTWLQANAVKQEATSDKFLYTI